MHPSGGIDFALSQVGEDVDVAKLQDDSSGWRGRAQQIILLRGKVKELRKELGRPGAESHRHDTNHRKNLAKLEETKKKEKEELTKELNGKAPAADLAFLGSHAVYGLCARAYTFSSCSCSCSCFTETVKEYRTFKQKYEALMSRKKNVETENRDLRQKLGMLLTKTENDDKLIEALKKEVHFLREKSESSAQEKLNQVPNKRVLTVLPSQEAVVKQQQEQILRQEKIILGLTGKLNEQAQYM